jgi:hypothetical protein
MVSIAANTDPGDYAQYGGGDLGRILISCSKWATVAVSRLLAPAQMCRPSAKLTVVSDDALSVECRVRAYRLPDDSPDRRTMPHGIGNAELRATGQVEQELTRRRHSARQ